MKIAFPTLNNSPPSPTSRRSSEKNPMNDQLKEMKDLDNFFAKKLTMKEIDSYLNDNKLQFNYNQNEQQDEEEEEEDDEYGAEEIIK